MLDEPRELTGVPQESLREGWRTILALFLCTLALFGVSIYSFIVLAHPLGIEYGWSSAEVGGAVSAMWLTAPVALLSGTLHKRWRPWTIIYAGLLTQAAAFLLLPLIEKIEMLYLLRLMMGVGKVAMITAVPIVVTTRFSRRFATAMAIVWAGGAAGGFLLSPLTNLLLQNVGWRTAATVIGCGLIVGVGLIAMLAKGSAASTALANPALEHEESLRNEEPGNDLESKSGSAGSSFAVIHKPTALGMLVAVIGIGMASIAVLTQEQAVFERAGIKGDQAATYLGLTAVGSLLGSASIGWLLDRQTARWSGLLTAMTIYSGLVAFAFLGNDGDQAAALFASISCGYAFGAGEVLWITLTKRQFGEHVFATTYGGWYFALQIGYAAGGGVAGWSFGQFGTSGFLWFVALMYLPAALLSLTLRSARMAPDKG